MKKRHILLGLALALAPALQAQDTPLMGWSSWNSFGFKITDQLIKETATAMVETGLAKAGYNYVNIDDGYFGGRDAEGNLLIHKERFPGGMKAVVDHIHSLRLKAGIYTDAGTSTCASYFGGDKIGVNVGIYRHETGDTRLWFNELGFDFIKIDFCGGSPYHNALRRDLPERDQYTDIARAIHATGRKVRLNVCRWDYPGTWVSQVAESWRTTGDINCSWGSVKGILLQNLYLSAYATKGHYNDMDMLEVGRGLSDEEDKTHFGMWCIMNSPLLIGCDVRHIAPKAFQLMTNPELIALNQDPLGEQAYLATKNDECYVLVKDLKRQQGKERAVAVFNPTDQERHCRFNLYHIDLAGQTTLRDLYEHTDATQLLNPATGDIDVTLPPHATRIYKVKAQQRLERTHYEAETAYIPAYQELENNQTAETGTYEYDPRCHGGLKATWLGKGENNCLVFKDVYSQKGGQYELAIGYETPETRSLQVLVNGQRADFVTVEKGNATTRLKITLPKGHNTLTLRNLQEWMPDIDFIELNRNK